MSDMIHQSDFRIEKPNYKTFHRDRYLKKKTSNPNKNYPS